MCGLKPWKITCILLTNHRYLSSFIMKQVRFTGRTVYLQNSTRMNLLSVTAPSKLSFVKTSTPFSSAMSAIAHTKRQRDSNLTNIVGEIFQCVCVLFSTWQMRPVTVRMSRLIQHKFACCTLIGQISGSRVSRSFPFLSKNTFLNPGT